MILKNIRLNAETQHYVVREAGILYEINAKLLDSMKDFFRDNPYRLVSAWYKGLEEEERKLVRKRVGG